MLNRWKIKHIGQIFLTGRYWSIVGWGYSLWNELKTFR